MGGCFAPKYEPVIFAKEFVVQISETKQYKGLTNNRVKLVKRISSKGSNNGLTDPSVYNRPMHRPIH